MTTKILTGVYAAEYLLKSPVTTVSITATAYLGYGLASAGVGTYTVVNAGVVKSSIEAISLAGSGVITNSGSILQVMDGGAALVMNGGTAGNTGLIRGYNGVVIGANAAMITNTGTIIGSVDSGVYLKGGGEVVNGSTLVTSAVIQGATAVGAGNAATLINYGTVQGDGTVGAAAYFLAGGTITNGSTLDTTALIDATGIGVEIRGALGVLNNFGTVRALAGVDIESGGSVRNGTASDTKALIDGGLIGIAARYDPATVTNFGTIVAQYGASIGLYGAVVLQMGGAITNGSASDKTAFMTGVVGAAVGGATGDIANYATIGGPLCFVGELAGYGGIVTNGSAADTTALVEAFIGLAGTSEPTTIRNFGTIIGTSAALSVTTAGAIVLTGGGHIYNGTSVDTKALASGLIGAYTSNYATTVTNFGTFEGSLAGVDITYGGKVQNGSASVLSALVSGAYFGVYCPGSLATTVDNFGTVRAGIVGGTAVKLAGGGTLVNGASTDTTAHISGNVGVVIEAAGEVVNWAKISAGTPADSVGVSMYYKDLLSNQAKASIVGYFGVKAGKYCTINNFGTISVTGDGLTGVALIAASARMNAQAGSVVIGQLSAGAGTVDVVGGIATVGALASSGKVIGAGTLALNGAGYARSVLATGATLSVAEIRLSGANSNVEITGVVSDAKKWVQSAGSITVNSGDKMTFTGTGDSFSGTLTGLGTISFAGGTDALSNLHMSAASMVVNGASVSVAGAIVLSKTLTVTATNFTVAAAGATLTGGGTLTLSNHSTNVIKGASSGATLTNTNDKITGAGNLGNGTMTLVNQAGGVINGNVSNTLTINTGAATITNAGVIESTSTGGVRILSAVANSGKLTVNAGVLELDGAISGAGSVHIGGGLADVVTSTFTQAVAFTGSTGTLELANSQGYTGKITGFSKAGGTFLDLTDIAFASATASYSGATASGVLTVTDGAHTAKISLVGDYTGSSWVLAADSGTGVLIKDPTAPPAAPHFASAMAGFGARTGAGGSLSAAAQRQPLPILVKTA
jgi:hypothetical protein